MPVDRGKIRAGIRDAIQSQPYVPATVLSSLLAIQDALGYLPPEAMEEVAHRTGETINDVWAVASFYLNFRFSPPGGHNVEVCWGPTCHVRGAMELLRGMLDHLGLDGEGDTPDRQVSLKLNTCLGACPHGPVISVDGRLWGNTTLEQARSTLDDLGPAQPPRGNGKP